MVKLKKRHNLLAKKNQSRGAPTVNPPDEDDWIFIKKQRVTIIIPPLPNKNLSKPSVEDCHPPEKPKTTGISKSPRKTNSQLQCPSVVSASKESVHEPEKSMSFPEPANEPPIVEHSSEPKLNIQNPSSLSHRIASDNSPLHSQSERNRVGVCCTSIGRKRMKFFYDNNLLLNQRMRAWYLEKKLKRAGGLENWLVSLGLARFVKIFRIKSVNKFQLANLTMQKLKDMGTDAVGPRRKLMHAIDCLCEPHCFQNVQM